MSDEPIEWSEPHREMKARDHQGTYFWLFRCERSCSFWLTAPTRAGDPNWMKACPYDASPLRRV